MTFQTHKVKFTYEDYLLFPDDGKRHELIDGDHFMTPAPSTRHQKVSSNLHRILSVFVHEKHFGTLLSAPTDVLFSDLEVVQPDLLFISSGRTTIITEKNIQGPPDLVVEIISENTRKTDEIMKRKLYERYRVSEYWVVDPELQTVKIYRMTDQGYIRVAELDHAANDMLATPLLPGFQISLSQVFE